MDRSINTAINTNNILHQLDDCKSKILNALLGKLRENSSCDKGPIQITDKLNI